MNKRTKKYNEEFRAMKFLILQRDNFRCLKCNDYTSSSELDVHHIIRRSTGGLNAPANLITLCRMHHDEIHSMASEKGKLECRNTLERFYGYNYF